jgi:hypothetical protein
MKSNSQRREDSESNVQREEPESVSQSGWNIGADLDLDLFDDNPSESVSGENRAPIDLTGIWPINTPDEADNQLSENRLPIELSGNPSTWTQDLQVPDIDDIVNTDPQTSSHEEDTITAGAIYQERAKFVSAQFQTYPRLFYEKGQTPFIHRHLYASCLPDIILDALSACALYCGKNKENESLVLADISKKALELAVADKVFTCPVQQLASTQALLLYQIIRLFDGDIRLRADAEACETALAAWTDQICKRMKALPRSFSPENHSIPVGNTAWNDWIFEESCRRTVLVSYMLRCSYSFLKFGFDTLSHKIRELSFTAQAALWEAPSEFHWLEVCKERMGFLVMVENWDADMRGVKPSDIEGLGIVTMATLKGVDLTCEWLGRDNLSEWGLEWPSI